MKTDRLGDEMGDRRQTDRQAGRYTCIQTDREMLRQSEGKEGEGRGGVNEGHKKSWSLREIITA